MVTSDPNPLYLDQHIMISAVKLARLIYSVLTLNVSVFRHFTWTSCFIALLSVFSLFSQASSNTNAHTLSSSLMNPCRVCWSTSFLIHLDALLMQLKGLRETQRTRGRETGLCCCRSFWCPSTMSRNPKHIHLTEKHQHVIEAWTSCRQLVISHWVDNLINTWNSCCITAYVNVETNYFVANTLEILQLNADNWEKNILMKLHFQLLA